MKKLAIIFFVFALQLFAQNGKGNISLVFNDEKFDLPVSVISINKADKIIVSARAEKTDSSYSQWVSLEMTFDNLSGQTVKGGAKTFNFQIQSSDKAGRNGKRLTFNLASGGVHVEYIRNGDRISMQMNSLSFVLNVTEINYNGEFLVLKGQFHGTVRSNTLQDANVKAEIKDGTFELDL